ncbi:MAG: hypothetical protein ACTSRW_12130 [Candidatus Helarchaeota archaeon]
MVTSWNIFLAMIIEFAITGIMLMIFLLFLNKYLKNKSRPRLYMVYTMLAWTISGFFTAIGRAHFLIQLFLTNQLFTYNVTAYIPDSFLILTLACFALANAFYMVFIQDFFEKSKTILIVYIIFDSIGIIGFLILAAIFPFLGTSAELVFTLLWSYQAILTLFVSLYLSVSAFKNASKTSNRIFKHGSQLIGLSGILMVFINIMFVIDEFIVPGFGGAFSIFYYLGWFFVIVSAIFVYLGFILPNWLRTRWE